MTGKPFWTANASHPARPPKHQPPRPPGAAATSLCPCGVLLKARTMDGQTDRHCPCCTEEEEGELKRHSHLGLKKQTPAQDCACGPDSLAGGHCPPAPGVSVLHLHPPQGQPSVPDGQGHPQRVTALAWGTAWHRPALHPPLHVMVRITCVLCLVLARFHPKGLPQGISPTGSAWIWGEGWLEGQGEQAGAVQAPRTGNCHKHIRGCCLQFSHTAREDAGGMLLLKAGELCWFQPG